MCRFYLLKHRQIVVRFSLIFHRFVELVLHWLLLPYSPWKQILRIKKFRMFILHLHNPFHISWFNEYGNGEKSSCNQTTNCMATNIQNTMFWLERKKKKKTSDENRFDHLQNWRLHEQRWHLFHKDFLHILLLQ